jgi:hypothetical protein
VLDMTPGAAIGAAGSLLPPRGSPARSSSACTRSAISAGWGRQAHEVVEWWHDTRAQGRCPLYGQDEQRRDGWGLVEQVVQHREGVGGGTGGVQDRYAAPIGFGEHSRDHVALVTRQRP